MTFHAVLILRAREIADFFVNYKRLEPKKWVKVKEWKDAKAAEKMILSASQPYKEEFHTT